MRLGHAIRSMGSLQYIWVSFGLPPSLAPHLNQSLIAEESMRHRWPPNPSVGCSESVHHSDR